MDSHRRRCFALAVQGGLLLTLVAALWPTWAAAGRIEGRIRFGGTRAEAARPNPYPGQLGSQLAAGEVRDDSVEELAIYLRGSEDPRATDADRPIPELRQRQLRFEPRVLAVPIGTTVSFPNLDAVFHNVFSYSKTKRFDLGRYGKGKTKTVRFDEAGLVEVFCDVHSSMHAYILIVDSAYVTQPDAEGRFVIDGVPEGPQSLVIWHPELGEQEFTVVVGDEPVQLDLSF